MLSNGQNRTRANTVVDPGSIRSCEIFLYSGEFYISHKVGRVRRCLIIVEPSRIQLTMGSFDT